MTLKIDAGATFQDFVSVTDLLAKNEIKDVAIVATKGGEKSKSTDAPLATPAAPQKGNAETKSAAQ